MRTYLLTLIALTLAACGSDNNGPARVEVEGAWFGSFPFTGGGNGTLQLTLQETNGQVTGSGSIGFDQAVAVTAQGTYSPPAVSLTLSAPGYSNINLTGTVAQTQITGQMNGSGFTATSVTLTRQ